MNEIVLFLCLVFSATAAIVSLIALVGQKKGEKGLNREEMDRYAERGERNLAAVRREIGESVAKSLESNARQVREHQSEVFSRQDQRLLELTHNLERSLETLRVTLESSAKQLGERMGEMNTQQETQATALRNTVDVKLRELRQDNEKSLGQIRQSVEEKLQTTLEERISRSFKEVSDRLQQVYQGLGEMQNLASGVGDLKKVLSNVKTRGILGESQLSAILEDILSPEQFERNVTTVPGSRTSVEFAVRLPGDGDGVVYLPIDSKFPLESYLALQDAMENSNAEQVKEARSLLERSIKSFAKDIRDKYINPPISTDFAIMFLPTEGLYAEVVRMGLIETLQRQYKVNIAGPTTMAALLNSLQTGFRTLAIQKRSSEVWEVLGAVRTEFEKFDKILRDTQSRLNMASNSLEELVGVRTRQMQRRLKSVSILPQDRAEALLSEENDAEE